MPLEMFTTFPSVVTSFLDVGLDGSAGFPSQVFDLEGLAFLGGENPGGYGPWLRKYEMLAVGHGTEVRALFPATAFSGWPRPRFNQFSSFWKSSMRLPQTCKTNAASIKVADCFL